MSVRQGNKIIAGVNKPVSINIGTIFSAPYADGYIPVGAVLADGAEYDASAYPTLWRDYIQGGRVLTCTYSEFQQEVSTKGFCYKFAVNGNNFKVPYKVNEVAGKSVGVRGNGIALGFTDNKDNFGLVNGNGAGLQYTFSDRNMYGKPTGTSSSSGAYATNYKAVGITTNASKSGMVADLPKEPVKFYVQVAGGTVTDSLKEWFITEINGKADVDSYVPDYSRAIDISGRSTYTAITSCWVVGASLQPAGSEQKILVNNIVIANEAGDYADFQYMLNKGDVLSASVGTFWKATILPLKGAK